MILGNSIFCLPKGDYTHLRQEIVLGSVQMDAPNTQEKTSGRMLEAPMVP